MAGDVGQGTCLGRACGCLGNSSAGRVAGCEGDKAQRLKLCLHLPRIKSPNVPPFVLEAGIRAVWHGRGLEGLEFLVLSKLGKGLSSSQPISLLVTVLFGLFQFLGSAVY